MPFIRRYRGGIYPTGKLPLVFALFCFLILFFHTITNARPRPPEPYVIVSRDRLSTGGTSFVVNVRFFIDS